MKKLVLLLALVWAACAPQPAPNPDLPRWQQEAQNVTIVRDDWGIAHVHGKTDADAVFGMIYAQAEDDFNRVETNYLYSMGRLAEAEGEPQIYRDLRMKLFIDPVAMKAKYDDEPGLAEGADERVGRRAELLPLHAPRGEAPGHHALRAVDGADLQRGQHRRRHRARGPPRARGVLRPRLGGGAGGRRGRRRAARADGLERHRDRAVEHRRSPRAAAHQPPHVVLLPLRAADDERRGAERVRRGHVGPVLRLPGLQRARGLDAHVERRGQHRRVPGDGHEEGRHLLLPLRRGGEARHDPDDHGALQDGHRHGRQDLHRLLHPARPGRPLRGRQVDHRPSDAGAPEGAHAVLHADQGDRLHVVPRDDGAAHQLVEQHHLRGRRRRHRLLPLELHSPARPDVRLDEAGGRLGPDDRLARRAVDRRDARPAEPRGRLALQQQQLAMVGGRPRQPEARELPVLRGAGRVRDAARLPRPPRARAREGLHASTR